ncbi:MAG: DUF445 family protein [Bdellovibrionota bacterium]
MQPSLSVHASGAPEAPAPPPLAEAPPAGETAEASPTPGMDWKEFLADHKGNISLGLSALVFGTSYAFPPAIAFWVRSAGEAALVGSLVDFMAIKMLFERYSWLPGSGVIPRNRERIIEGLAHSVEHEWLTPETLKSHFAKLDLQGLYRGAIQRIKDDEELLHLILAEVGKNGVTWIDNHDFLAFLSKKIREKVGRLGKFADNVGVLDIDGMVGEIGENLAHEIEHLHENEEVKAFIRQELGKITERTTDSPAVTERLEKLKSSVIDTIFSRLEGRIFDMVKDNLSKFSDKEIQYMFESKTRKHLEWIRVNGAIYGGLFGLVLAALSRYFGGGAH